MALKRRRRKVIELNMKSTLKTTLYLIPLTAAILSVESLQQLDGWHQRTSSSQQQQQQQSLTNLDSYQFQPQAHSTSHLCAMLPDEVSRQLKLCKLIRHSAQANEAVSQGALRGLAQCRAQFSRDRWNCTHIHGDNHLLIGELTQSLGNKESAFVQAISAAGIVHSIANACSAGTLSDCACDKSRVGFIKQHEEEIWKWGGCSNNVRHGMHYAKHLVELLDSVHQHRTAQRLHHQRLIQSDQQYISSHHSSHLPNSRLHNIEKRSLNYRRISGPVRAQSRLSTSSSFIPPAASSSSYYPSQLTANYQSDQSNQPVVNSVTNNNLGGELAAFCKQNHNISHTTHKQLIKSMLAEHSLEKHQEIRLAVNMHNNKIGRMAVAKNMELKCRCHGLSGSCSLKTCWLVLPDFQVIGNYLKNKYDSSVHIPTALNLNKLIPLMDRNEIAAILSNRLTVVESPLQISPTTPTTTSVEFGEHQRQQPEKVNLGFASGQPPLPEFAALTSSSAGSYPLPPSSPPVNNNKLFVPIQQPANKLSSPIYSYYERHKLAQLQQLNSNPIPPPVYSSPTNQNNYNNNNNNNNASSTKLISSDELNDIPVNTSPLTSAQYQALLKELKLCNSTSNNNNDQLQTTNNLRHIAYLNQQKQKQHLRSHQHHASADPASTLHGQQIKVANQIMGQLLHGHDKDELVHLHKSPSYCKPDHRHGFAGVQSRECSLDKLAPDSCDRLCCGRGSTTITYKKSYKCECKFQYCCSISCSVCEDTIKVEVCN